MIHILSWKYDIGTDDFLDKVGGIDWENQKEISIELNINLKTLSRMISRLKEENEMGEVLEVWYPISSALVELVVYTTYILFFVSSNRTIGRVPPLFVTLYRVQLLSFLSNNPIVIWLSEL